MGGSYNAAFDAWFKRAVVRWRDTKERLSLAEGRALRVVCQYLAANARARATA